MTTLESLRIRNWRGISEVTFQPRLEGLTGVSGSNGASKSTLQDALSWVLLDELPDGARKSDLRRWKSSTKDECSVSAVIHHNGQKVEVVRQLTGKNHTTDVNVYVDGRVQTHTSVKVANQWIKDRLGFDSDTFFTIHVIKQKQLDTLIEARSAERRMMIEKFFGVEKMSEALKAARAEANDAGKVAKALPGSEESVKEVSSLLENCASKVDNESEQVTYVETSLETLENHLVEAETHHATLVEQRRVKSEADTKVERSHHAVNLAEERFNALRNQRRDAQRRAEGGSQTTLDAIKEQGQQVSESIKVLRDALQTYTQQKTRLEVAVQNSERNHEQASQAVIALTAKVDENKSRLSSLSVPDSTDFDKLIADIQAEKIAKQSEINGYRVRVDRLNKSVNSLSTDVHGADCPTCHQHLANPQELIDTLNREADELNASVERLLIEIKTLDVKVAETTSQKAHNASLTSERAALESEAERLSQALTEAHSAVSRSQDNIATSAREIEEYTSQNDAEVIVQKISTLDDELTEIRTRYASAQEAQKAEQDVARFEREISTLAEEIEGLEYTAALNESYALDLVVPEEENLTEASTKVQRLRNSVQEKRNILQTTYGNHRAAVATHEATREQLAREKRLLSQKRAALDEAEEKTAVAELLEEFRRDRLARIAPELSEASSTIISSITDGFYLEVNISDDFTPSLVQHDGTVVPLSGLSGGEKSIVALALRIAIGNMLSNGRGLLWLDEALVSQDAPRRSATVQTLRHLGRQVIMVNHTQGSEDAVDLLVTLVKDTENGSYLQTSD